MKIFNLLKFNKFILGMIVGVFVTCLSMGIVQYRKKQKEKKAQELRIVMDKGVKRKAIKEEKRRQKVHHVNAELGREGIKTIDYIPHFDEKFNFYMTSSEKYGPGYYGCITIGKQYRWIDIQQEDYYKMRKVLMAWMKKRDKSLAEIRAMTKKAINWRKSGSWKWVTK